MMTPFNGRPPMGQPTAPSMPNQAQQHDWSNTPLGAAFAMSNGPGMSGLAQQFHNSPPAGLDGGFGQYLQALRSPQAPSPQAPPVQTMPVAQSQGMPQAPQLPQQAPMAQPYGFQRPMMQPPFMGFPQQRPMMPSWLQNRFNGR